MDIRLQGQTNNNEHFHSGQDSSMAKKKQAEEEKICTDF